MNNNKKTVDFNKLFVEAPKFEETKGIDIKPRLRKSSKPKQEGRIGVKTGIKFIRKTYHLEEWHHYALSLYSAEEEMEKSDIVRQALENFIPERYLKEGKLRYSQE